MNEISTVESKENVNVLEFKNDELGRIRSISINDEPWFVGKDIAVVLGYSNPQKAVRDHVDDDDRTVNDSFTVNGTPIMLINESGLYALILSSKLPNVKKFKRWVTNEVLPSIRKTGKYAVQPQQGKTELALEDMEKKMEAMYTQLSDMKAQIDTLCDTTNRIVDNTSLSTRQQQKIYQAVRDRVSGLLGGIHSEEYRMYSKLYFITLWNCLKREFDCASSYKDMNPMYFNDALEYIKNWFYIDHINENNGDILEFKSKAKEETVKPTESPVYTGYTIRGQSSKGTVYLAKGWYNKKTPWEQQITPEILFKTPRAAKTSLTRLRKKGMGFTKGKFAVCAVKIEDGIVSVR